MTSDWTIVTSGHHGSIRTTFTSLNSTIWQSIVLFRKLATGSIHDYIFCYSPLLDILFEALRISIAPVISQYESYSCVFVLLYSMKVSYTSDYVLQWCNIPNMKHTIRSKTMSAWPLLYSSSLHNKGIPLEFNMQYHNRGTPL